MGRSRRSGAGAVRLRQRFGGSARAGLVAPPGSHRGGIFLRQQESGNASGDLGRLLVEIVVLPRGVDRASGVAYRLSRRLDQRRLHLAVTPDARGWLAERGYDPIYGARPLRRLMQKEIDDRLRWAYLRALSRERLTCSSTR